LFNPKNSWEQAQEAALRMRFALFLAVLASRICIQSIIHSLNINIKKVGIVGCGPAGLMLAASLKRLNSGVEEILLFDKRPDVLNIGGGGLQISGGSIVMEKIGLLDELINVGHPLHNVLARNRDGDVLLDLDVENLVTTKAKEELCVNNKPVIFSIMRNALQSILYNAAVTNEHGNCRVKVVTNAKCRNIIENNNKVSLEFDNNDKHDDFDMIFGTGSELIKLRIITEPLDLNFYDFFR
jgi:2-polyprenyl-6-methoxyphenol hydroxylase-like FAD-dependent oxidoreductase